MAPPPGRRIIGLSTKMYFSASRTNEYTTTLLTYLASLSKDTLSSVDIFMIPDFVSLTSTVSLLSSSELSVRIWPGAQDCHWEDSGAFTGEVSPAVLREVGVKIVEVGHAERRRIFGEDDVVTAKKAAAVARNNMIPLVCIGEKMKEGGVVAAVEQCRTQIEPVVRAVEDDKEIVFAYEPVWAIGASQPADEDHVLEVVEGIRQLPAIKSKKGIIRIVYGGSAGPGLYEKLSSGLDGLFLGRFGHDPERFAKTILEVAKS